jgi:hypothetical protein
VDTILKAREPFAERVPVTLNVQGDRASTVYEEPPEIFIAALANSYKFRLAACRSLLRNKPEPR